MFFARKKRSGGQTFFEFIPTHTPARVLDLREEPGTPLPKQRLVTELRVKRSRGRA